METLDSMINARPSREGDKRYAVGDEAAPAVVLAPGVILQAQKFQKLEDLHNSGAIKERDHLPENDLIYQASVLAEMIAPRAVVAVPSEQTDPDGMADDEETEFDDESDDWDDDDDDFDDDYEDDFDDDYEDDDDL